jgi:hypothetical protein
MPCSPSIVPEDTNRDVYLVLDHFGVLGRVWRETDETDANRARVIQDLLDGQYEEPVRIVALDRLRSGSSTELKIHDPLHRRMLPVLYLDPVLLPAAAVRPARWLDTNPRAELTGLRRRSKWQQRRREDLKKDPRDEDEKEHLLPR